ncbi:hypothetical protein AAHC03_025959 [Spirometra sp. Aus1]
MPTEDFLQIQNEWRLRILRKTEESDSCIISECSSNDADLLAADQLELTRIQLQMSQQSEFLLQQKLASLKVGCYSSSHMPAWALLPSRLIEVCLRITRAIPLGS